MKNIPLTTISRITGHQTYFVVNRKRDRHNSYHHQNELLPDHSQLLLVSQPGSNGFLCGVQLSQSATNVSAIHPSVPPASPVGQTSTSLNPSPNLSDRPRLASFNRVTKYLVSAATSKDKQPNDMSGKPKIVVSTRSLPESLTSDREDDGCCRGGSSKPNKDDDCQESARKYSAKYLNWKVRKFLRKNDSTSCMDAKKAEIAKRLDEVTCLEQNGYQKLPIVIETLCSNSNSLDVPIRSLNSRSPDNSNSPVQHSMFDDIIDVRSYISQSRSDISPFGRSGSYRSQSGRSPNSDVSPIGRPRAATVAEHLIIDTCPAATTMLTTLTRKQSSAAHAICAAPAPAPISHYALDSLSICPSATSRKDSGIRSNSRRSSIQLQIYAANLSAISQQRVSGYFTSSQSSISELPAPVLTPTAPDPDPLGACLQQLRKQSDLQLIRCVRDNAKSQRSYFVKPPLTNVSLFFKSRQMEREFRSNAHRFGCERQYEGPPTLATPKYNTYIDIFVGIIVYFVVSASLFLLSLAEYNAPFRIWVSLFTVFSAVQFFALFLFTKQMCRMRSSSPPSASSSVSTHATAANCAVVPVGAAHPYHPNHNHHNHQHHLRKPKPSCEDNFFEAISSWYPWHICLGVLISLPVILIIVNFSLQSTERLSAFEYHYGFLIFVCIIHFCNFTQLNCWMRNVLATMAALAFVGIAIHQLGANSMRDALLSNRSAANGTSDGGPIVTLLLNATEAIYLNATGLVASTTIAATATPNWFQVYHVEIYMDLVLVLILVWFLNREFEIGYRLTFYGNAVANQDKSRVQMMKNQADMLLHNIIPKHVAEHLKNTAKYSENHRNVSIIFASIVNFNELYDESYLGGKEYLRVLNELIGDFDELLSRPEFRCVEKIKTIGSTFMAASGLDPLCRGTNNEHIVALMNFAFAMQSVIASFNKDLLEFNLILRIGFNVGDVTAGVIGTSKLHYDIWGDSVNVASRMDSTGVAGRIQVGKACLSFLEDHFEYEARGKVYVKGKDHMEVFLINGRKETVGLNGGSVFVDYERTDLYNNVIC